MKHPGRIIRLELSVIYLIAALLVISGLGLIVKMAATNIGQPEWYPRLYVTGRASFVIPEQKTVYLTFDDGPSKNTEHVLDVLADRGVPATFFVTAQRAEEDYTPVMLQRMVDEGHSIGLHSYMHEANKIYRSLDNYMEDLNKLNEYLNDTVGIRPEFLRFAGGSATVMAEPYVMREIIAEIGKRGYQFYDWDIVSGDDTPHATQVGELVDNIMSGVKRCGDRQQLVILLHDNPAATTTPEATGIVIDELKKQGYQFEKITPEVQPVHLKSNRLED